MVEQAGRDPGARRGRTLERPFLDISGLVSSRADSEHGLLSVAFPPDYRHSRRFYVYYTDTDGDIASTSSSARDAHAGASRPRPRP